MMRKNFPIHMQNGRQRLSIWTESGTIDKNTNKCSPPPSHKIKQCKAPHKLLSLVKPSPLCFITLIPMFLPLSPLPPPKSKMSLWTLTILITMLLLVVIPRNGLNAFASIANNQATWAETVHRSPSEEQHSEAHSLIQLKKQPAIKEKNAKKI